MMYFDLMYVNEKYGSVGVDFTTNDRGERTYTYSNLKITNPNLVPFLVDPKLNTEFWLQIRATMNNTDSTWSNLRNHGYELNDIEYLFKNFWISTDDGYWCRPEVLPDLQYEDIALDNYMVLMPVIPYSEYHLKGPYTEVDINNVKLRWDYTLKSPEFQKAYMFKRSWQAINELVARFVHEKQKSNGDVLPIEIKEVIPDKDRIILVSPNFVKDNCDIVYGYQLFDDSSAESRGTQFFKNVSKYFKIPGDDIQAYWDYLVMLDFVLSNSDRAGQNYGIQKSRVTGNSEFLPGYDYERSMGYEEYKQMELIKDEPKDYQERVKKMLFERDTYKLFSVKDKNVLNLDALPTGEEIHDFYMQYDFNTMTEEQIDFAVEIYEYKKNYLKNM